MSIEEIWLEVIESGITWKVMEIWRVPWARLYDKRAPGMCIKNPCQNLGRKKKQTIIFFFKLFNFFPDFSWAKQRDGIKFKNQFYYYSFWFSFKGKRDCLGFYVLKNLRNEFLFILFTSEHFFFLLIVTRSRDNALQCMYKWPCCWYDKMPRGVYKSKFIFNFLYNTGLQHENYMSLFISLILPLPKLLQCDRYMYTQRRNSRFKWREKGGKTRMQVDRHLFLWVAVKHYRTLASYVSYSCCSRFFTIKKKKKMWPKNVARDSYLYYDSYERRRLLNGSFRGGGRGGGGGGKAWS